MNIHTSSDERKFVLSVSYVLNIERQRENTILKVIRCFLQVHLDAYFFQENPSQFEY